ncbi:MAG TPA: rhodanese-like domain-containing protein [Thermoleophilaceae bacterium]|nr:rhodanese-like domain-containing protein [Thermoleophilaceae bacterium]
MAADEQEVEPERVAELMSSGEAQVIDVRTDAEYEAGRIGGAEHVPFDELTARSETLDRSRPVVFYCQVGGRSAAAAQAFAASGWQAHTMAGGLAEWAERGLPLEPEDGSVKPPSGLPVP